MSSYFIERYSRSMKTLSIQRPRPSIEMRILALSSTPVKSPPVNWLPWMLFCSSSGEWKPIRLAPALVDEAEDLSCNVAFDAANGFEFGVALGDTLCDVGLGSAISPKAADGN